MGDLGERFSGLRSPPEGGRPKFEGSQGGIANRIGAAVHAEKQPVGLPRGDQIAATMLAGKAVGVLLLNVPADLLPIVKDLASWPEKEIIRNHTRFALPYGYNFFPRRSVPCTLSPGCRAADGSCHTMRLGVNHAGFIL